MDYFQRLFRSRPWQKLIPDFEHSVITGGFGTWGLKDYVTAAITSDGNSIIAYLPSKRTVIADLTKLEGKNAKCWWYNPSTGTAINTGIFQTSGSQSFTPPGEGDWVLVIDNASANLPEPGRLK